MLRPMLIGKIHRATVTKSDLHYVGSITIDAALMEAAGLFPGQQVDVVDVTNGERLTTYAIPGERDSSMVCINGAAAHRIHPGDLIIVIAYGLLDEDEARRWAAKVVFVDANNTIVTTGDDPGEVPSGFGVFPSGLRLLDYAPNAGTNRPSTDG